LKSRFLIFLILFSCSSWKQKDFEKDLKKTSEVVKPSIVASSDEKLLEKFEVLPAEAVNPKEGEGLSKVNPKIEKKNLVKKQLIKNEVVISKDKTVRATPPSASAPMEKVYPKDYPSHFLSINSKAKKVWDLYRPNHFEGQKIFLDIHYLGMTVGKIMVLNKGKKTINNKEVWHFHARFKSAPFYSNIYELDDTVDTYVTTDDFLSSRYSLIQRETKQDIDDLQLHDRDQLKTFWFYHQKKSNGDVKDKKVEKYIPYFSVDPFSVLFFYQGLPLKNGDLYEIPLINKGKILIFKSVVEGRETIKTIKGNKKAIRIHATTNYSGATLKSGDLYFWFSDDDHRTLLKAQAKIKIGSVTADVVDK
jgi:hypothetical protein